MYQPLGEKSEISWVGLFLCEGFCNEYLEECHDYDTCLQGLLTKLALREWRDTCCSFYLVKLVLFGTVFFLKFNT